MHVVATAGHVDHGKSTLVRALTGMEPDRWAEERRRGMTIDLGFAWTALPSGATVAFVDVPGHERFVSNMLAGVGPVPAVIMVVAADEGWMPQSAEHLDALEALGVRDGLLVITRSDLMDPELARDEAGEHLAGSTLGRLPAVCVSGLTGAGLDELRSALDDLVRRLPAADPGADVRLWVDRAFTIRGAGTVVTGTLPAGRVRIDDELELAGRRVSVRGLQSLGESVSEATAVARVALNLRGVPLESVARGDVLLTPGAWARAAVVDVRLHGLRGRPAAAGELPGQLMLHIGSAAVAVRVRPLGTDVARLRLDTALPLRIGDRAVLRDPGRRRIAAGLTVLDVRPPALRRRGDAARRAAALAGMSGIADPFAELTRRRLVRTAELAAMGADPRPLHAAGVPSAGGWLLDPALVPELAARLAKAVTEHDATDPLDPGLPVEAARRVLGLPDARLLEPVLGASDVLLLRHGRVVRSTAAALPPAVRAAMEQLRADLERNPFAAPVADRLDELRLGPRQLATLVRAGELMRIADGIYLLPGTDERAVRVLAGLGDEFTLSSARQALGTSRRVAVPLLELLARSGRTRRTPDGGHRLVDPPR